MQLIKNYAAKTGYLKHIVKSIVNIAQQKLWQYCDINMNLIFSRSVADKIIKKGMEKVCKVLRKKLP